MTKRYVGLFLSTLLPAVACTSARIGSTESGQPTMTFPARYEAADAGSASPAVDLDRRDILEAGVPQSRTWAPDPTPLRSQLQWEYLFRYRHGTVSVQSVRKLRFDQPVVTARRIGRFAVELWIGHELVDRVRFDFPLLAAETPPQGKRHPLHEPPSLLAHADVSQRVLVPQSARATRAVLLDRATGEQLSLPWPPDSPILGSDAGGAPIRPRSQM